METETRWRVAALASWGGRQLEELGQTSAARAIGRDSDGDVDILEVPGARCLVQYIAYRCGCKNNDAELWWMLDVTPGG